MYQNLDQNFNKQSPLSNIIFDPFRKIAFKFFVFNYSIHFVFFYFLAKYLNSLKDLLNYNIPDQKMRKPQYVVSRNSTFILVHNGFKFTKCGKRTMYGRNELKTLWRCSYKENNRYICKAKAYTYLKPDGTERAEYRGTHPHEPQL